MYSPLRRKKPFLGQESDDKRFYQCFGKEKQRGHDRKFFSKGVMVSGGIGANVTTIFHFLQKTIDLQKNRKLPEEDYISFHQPSLNLLQDSATPHTSDETMIFLEERNIEDLD